jgi:hypothetical protein
MSQILDAQSCAQCVSIGRVANGQCGETCAPPTETEFLAVKQDQGKNSGVYPDAVAKEMVQEIDHEIDSDSEVICMIFQATEQSKQDFEKFKLLAIPNGGSYDPIRRISSTEPPVTASSTREAKCFQRTRTMP